MTIQKQKINKPNRYYMDYLDPVKKKAHRRRLYVGYGLMSVLIAIATVILVYLGSGYYVDRQTGNLIQNGQIFVASRPEGATIYLNDKLQRTKTAGKMVVPSGVYTVTVKKEGYRDWSRTLALDGGSIRRLDYLLLLPTDLKSSIVQTFAEAPYQIVQSQNQRYISLLFTGAPNTLFIYDTDRPELAPIEIALPQSLLRDPATPQTFKVVEWAADARHLIVSSHDQSGAIRDYVLVSRDQQSAPINLSARIGLTTQLLSLVNGNHENYFVFDQAQKTLQTTTLDNPLLTLRLSAVEAFKAVDETTILYVTPSSDPQKMQARLTDGPSTYLIREVPRDSGYLFDIAKLGSTAVVAAGSAAENKVAVYRNPIGYLRANETRTLPLATTILHIDAPFGVAFSKDASVVMVHGPNKIATHYFEEDKTTRFDAPFTLSAQTPVSWLDGKHLAIVSATETLMIDFDGANKQSITTTHQNYGVMLDANADSLYTFSAPGRPFNIVRTPLLIEE